MDNMSINRHATKFDAETKLYNKFLSINMPYNVAIPVVVVHSEYVVIFALGLL